MQTGTQIGKYTIGRKLGAGGMADVYLATDSAMGRDVALKVLPPEFARDAERVHRFQKEVQASAALSHPNIIPVYDVGEAQAEGFTYHYYTMALLPGGDLKQRIEQCLTPEQSLSIIKAIAEALGYAHDKGLVHRDIKPENILFDESDRPVLTDLGIAKAINSGTKMTGTGMSIGTPHYMSPEQAKGDSDIDGRSDIYALGVMLFEMLTGSVPYQGDNTMAVGIMHIQNPLPELPQHLKQYQGLLDNCLAKNRANRYQHTQQLIGDIEKLVQRRVVAASQKTRVVQGINGNIQPSSNQGLKWGLGGALVSTLLVVGVYLYQQSIKPAGFASSASLATQIPRATQSNTQPIKPEIPQKSDAEKAQEQLKRIQVHQELESLVKQAIEDVEAMRLTRPVGNNALEKVYRALELNATYEPALEIKVTIVTRLKELAVGLLKKNKFLQAKSHLDRADRIIPQAIGNLEAYSQLIGDLKVEGRNVYLKNCAACHMPNGEGLKGVFPNLKNGNIKSHNFDLAIKAIVNGVKGTAMQKFKDKIEKDALIALLTYGANQWGQIKTDKIFLDELIDDFEEEMASGTAPRTYVTATKEISKPLERAMTGEEVYKKNCIACHETGVLGAPILGDTETWTFRMQRGNLLENAINGLRAMPPLGTCDICTREEIESAIHYMMGSKANAKASKSIEGDW